MALQPLDQQQSPSLDFQIALLNQEKIWCLLCDLGFPGGLDGKASAHSEGDLKFSIPGSGRSPGEGSGDPLQYSCLENPMDGGAWWATVHRAAKNQTQLRDFTFLSFLWDVNAIFKIVFSPLERMVQNSSPHY